METLYCGSLADTDGLSVLSYAPDTGFAVTQQADVQRPSYLALSDDGAMLLAATHVPMFDGEPGGGVCSFRADASGKDSSGTDASGEIFPAGGLTAVDRLRLPVTHAAYVSFDAAARHALVACTFGGAAAVVGVAADGTLGPITAVVRNPGKTLLPLGYTDRPNVPPLPPGVTLPHCARTDPSGRIAVVADMGQDLIHVFDFDENTGTLEPRRPYVTPAGSGPRHVLFHPTNGCAYVVSELACTLTVLDVDADAGAVLRHRQTVSTTPPETAHGNTASELRLHPSGRFAYVSNRGLDTIATFAIGDTGEVELLAQTGTEGRWPRGFGINAAGNRMFVANQHSDDVAAFTLDETAAVPHFEGHRASVKQPTCVIVR